MDKTFLSCRLIYAKWYMCYATRTDSTKMPCDIPFSNPYQHLKFFHPVLFHLLCFCLTVFSNDKLPNLTIRSVQVLVYNHLVVRRIAAVGELHLDLRLLQPLLNRVFRVRRSATQPCFEGFHGWRRQEEEAGAGEGRVRGDLFHALRGVS